VATICLNTMCDDDDGDDGHCSLDHFEVQSTVVLGSLDTSVPLYSDSNMYRNSN